MKFVKRHKLLRNLMQSDFIFNPHRNGSTKLIFPSLHIMCLLHN